MSGPSRLFLVRHGRTDLNDGLRLLGRTDAPLSEEGHQQARSTAQRLLDCAPHPAVIHSSPLQRARQTAHTLAQVLQVPVLPSPALLELGFGELEGSRLAQWPELQRTWKEDPGAFAPPGGETVAALGDRVEAFLRDLPPGQDQVLVAHLFVLLFGACRLLGLPPEEFRRFFLAPGDFLVLERDSGGRYSVQPQDPMDVLLPQLQVLARNWHGPLIGDAVKTHGRDPYLVLVGTLLSLRTKDETTAVALPRLWARASTPAAMVALGADAIAELIYPVGFYHTKAATLVQVSRLLLNEHQGQVPATMETLLALPGVGRKTANLVLSEGFGVPAICVDTHVHRISNRLGYVATKTPEETEQALRLKLAPRHWHSINELLVLFGQNLCKPLSPLCSQCPVTRSCPKVGVARRR